MDKLSGLKAILSEQLGWHKARVNFFAEALIGLLICRSVNFQEIAVSMPSSETMISSRYRRIQRFFSQFSLDYEIIALWLFRLFFSEDDSVYIAIDRTNWFFGKSKINIFMLSVCYEGIAIPIYWKLLNKAGNSTGKEQITLLERFVKTFGTHQIAGVLADREFPNEQFITWLNTLKIPFYIRIKSDTQVYIKKKKYKKVNQLFANLQPYQQEIFGMRVTIFGQKLYLTASVNERNERMIVATNHNPKVAIATYLRRWEIESLFQSLKGRGFRFEDTHVTKLERIERIIAFLAIAVAWAHRTGEWRAIKKPIPLKIIKGQRRPQFSYFKYGLDFIRDKLTQASLKITAFNCLVRKLIPNFAVTGGFT